MSIAIFLSICLPKTCDKSENLDKMCVQLWSLSPSLRKVHLLNNLLLDILCVIRTVKLNRVGKKENVKDQIDLQPHEGIGETYMFCI